MSEPQEPKKPTETEAIPSKYPLLKGTEDDIENRFTYHPPKPGQQERYVLLRNIGRYMAENIVCSAPPSRERAIAVTKLEEAIFWANAAIARNE